MLARVVIDQKIAMQSGVVARQADVVIVETEADVVVAAHVVEPGGALQFVRDAPDAEVEQGGFLGGDSLPQQGHQGGVVGNFAFFGIDRIFAEIFDHFDRCHDRLGNEQHARRRHLATVLHQL